MRYQKGYKDVTRRRIVEVASRQLRRDGVGASGVASLMAGAGLTHGGFYSHFPSKDALIEEAIERAIEQVGAWIAASVETSDDKFEALIRTYLSAEHRDHPESGCVAAALTPEIARHTPALRRLFTQSIDTHIGMLASLLPNSATPEARRSVATAIVSGTIGMMQLARAVDDAALSERILEDGIAACLNLARSIAA